MVLSFAAGVMLAAAVLGLVVPSLEFGGRYGIAVTVIGIFCGAGCLNLIDKIVPHLHRLMGADGEVARERLLTLKNNTDGFKIAEKDLEMRGSGDFFGTRQSGKMLSDIKNLRYPTSVIFTAKRLSDDAFEGRFDDERLRTAAIRKYESLKDVVLN